MTEHSEYFWYTLWVLMVAVIGSLSTAHSLILMGGVWW